MIKKSILVMAVLGIAFFLAGGSVLAEENTTEVGNVLAEEDTPAAAGQVETVDKPLEGSPFLITGKLPHLTKLLINQWENPELQLTEKQKAELLKVREETIATVKKLDQEIASLEESVAQYIFSDKTPTDLTPIIEIIAALKTKATLVHLQCIYNTRRILNEKQVQFLVNL